MFVGKVSGDQEAGGALDEGGDPTAILWVHHGIPFPIADPGAFGDLGGALVDVDAVGNPAVRRFPAMAAKARRPWSPQGSVGGSPFLGLPVDPLVDTFVTQVPAGVIGMLLASLGTDDLRRPVTLKPFSNRLKKFWFF